MKDRALEIHTEIKEKRSEIYQLERELGQIRKECKHTDTKREYDRDINEGRSYWDYTCNECGKTWSERA